MNKYAFRVSWQASPRSSFMASETSSFLKRSGILRVLQEPKSSLSSTARIHLFDGRVSEVGDAVEDLLQDFNG